MACRLEQVLLLEPIRYSAAVQKALQKQQQMRRRKTSIRRHWAFEQKFRQAEAAEERMAESAEPKVEQAQLRSRLACHLGQAPACPLKADGKNTHQQHRHNT